VRREANQTAIPTEQLKLQEDSNFIEANEDREDRNREASEERREAALCKARARKRKGKRDESFQRKKRNAAISSAIFARFLIDQR
jgi:hypothetical protein